LAASEAKTQIRLREQNVHHDSLVLPNPIAT
jgi:hypothetical protein